LPCQWVADIGRLAAESNPLKALFLRGLASGAGDEERENNFRGVIAHSLVAPIVNELMKPPVKERDDRQHSARLDNDVKQIIHLSGLPFAE
jgi:hypothetical protein